MLRELYKYIDYFNLIIEKNLINKVCKEKPTKYYSYLVTIIEQRTNI